MTKATDGVDLVHQRKPPFGRIGSPCKIMNMAVDGETLQPARWYVLAGSEIGNSVGNLREIVIGK